MTKLLYNVFNMSLRYKKIEKEVKAFANHRRIQVLELLDREKNLSVNKISQILGVGFFTISDHIRKLYDTGLVEKKNKGRFVINNISNKGKKVLSFCKMFKS